MDTDSCWPPRAESLICSRDEAEPGDLLAQSQEIAKEGFRLRHILILWEQSRSASLEEPVLQHDEFMLLAMVFFSATSIYLSGVFDYEMMHWDNMGILVPNLSEDEIQAHVQVILEISSVILKASDISPLLILFPLRVAGARSWQKWQQEHIQTLLEVVQQTFLVASAFKAELGQVWEDRRLLGFGA